MEDHCLKEESFMGSYSFFFFLCFMWSFLFVGTYELQSSQTQVLLQLRKHLEYPKQLEIWNNHSMDFCSLSYSTQVNITCQDDSVTELRIIGDKSGKMGDILDFAIPNHTLSESFSVDSFVTTLARLNSLRLLSLVNLGIWGPLSDKIHRLSSLEYLDLSSNYLFGSVPSKISTMVRLQTLKLDDNFFNDTLPNWFDSLSNLKVLSLRNNKFKDSTFPSSILSITTLTDLDMSGNGIGGKIPDLKSLIGLQVLDLSRNQLDSIVPAKIFSSPNITYLNFASNKLSGSLPNNLKCGSKLEFVDLSENLLTGDLPSCLRIESGKRVVKFDGNCLSVDIKHQHAKSYCGEVQMYKEQPRGKKSVGILVGVILGIFVVVVLLAFGALIMYRRYCTREISEQHLLQKAVQDSSASGFSSDVLTNARFVSQAAKLGTLGFPLCRSFTLEEIKEATNNFSNSAIIGEGSYGKLYKGKLENGTQVAVRCLPLSKKYSIRNLKLRLDLLGKLRHPNLACLLGHCIDAGGEDGYNENKVFLISEYVPNGSFRTHLSENSPKKVLNWTERVAILTGVAKAVHYLHTGVIPGFYYNRLKINNILLDEHQKAKLSDYGMSIISEQPENSRAKGEGPKSWQMMNLADDVYSFGFILLEALLVPSVSARKEAFVLHEMASFNSQDGWRQVVDPIVQATCSQESISIVITIMNKCISSESSPPSIEDVLWNLQYAAQVQETADGDQRFNTAPYH